MIAETHMRFITLGALRAVKLLPPQRSAGTPSTRTGASTTASLLPARASAVSHSRSCSGGGLPKPMERENHLRAGNRIATLSWYKDSGENGNKHSETVVKVQRRNALLTPCGHAGIYSCDSFFDSLFPDIAMDSFDAIDRFVAHLEERAGLDLDRYGNCRFRCLVNYVSEVAQQTFQTNATIIRSGLDDGKISLEDAGDLAADNFQLDFLAHRVRIVFDRCMACLLVVGKSARLGNYQVRVTPILGPGKALEVARAVSGST